MRTQTHIHPLPGVRLVVEVKRGYEARVVLNQLLKHTRLQIKFSCNMVGHGLCFCCVERPRCFSFVVRLWRGRVTRACRSSSHATCWAAAAFRCGVALLCAKLMAPRLWHGVTWAQWALHRIYFLTESP